VTSNPPDASKVAAAARHARARPAVLTETEKLLYPAWLDHDGATGGPSYLGHVVALLLIALPLLLGVLAALVVFVGD
jgi:hypothetical protein